MSKLLLLAFNSAMLSRIVILVNLVGPISFLQISSSLAVSLDISLPAEKTSGMKRLLVRDRTCVACLPTLLRYLSDCWMMWEGKETLYGALVVILVA